MKSIKVQLESRSALDCFRVAITSLYLAERADTQEDIEHHCITGITFAAFAIEAMLNHYGRIYFPDWNKRKGCRKSLHKEIFLAVGLQNYLGTKAYQDANRCFEFRDMFAHGKTIDETISVDLPEELDIDSITSKVISTKSNEFRRVNLYLLKLFIDTATRIEEDIEKTGYYPDQEFLPEEQREKLCESPLSVSGVRVW